MIEKWVEGKKVEGGGREEAEKDSSVESSVGGNEISVESKRMGGRGGGRAGSWATTIPEVRQDPTSSYLHSNISEQPGGRQTESAGQE